MTHNSIQRPILGQYGDLGTLYDARTDTFISKSLFTGPLPETTISVSKNSTGQIQRLSNDSYEQKFSSLKVGTNLGASFLSGMVNVAGAAEYLKDARLNTLVEEDSIHYAITTVEERLGFGNPDLNKLITLDPIQGSGATHILLGIGWGAQTIMTAKYRLVHESDRPGVKSQIEHIFKRIEYIIKSGDKNGFPYQNVYQGGSTPIDITVYSDILHEPVHTAELQRASDFILGLPHRMAQINSGKGMPLTCTLMPLEMLTYMLNVEVRADVPFSQPSLNYLEGFLTFFDELRDSQLKLHGYYLEITRHKHCVPHQYIKDVIGCRDTLKGAEKTLRSNLARLLKDVRSSMADQSELTNLLEVARRGVASPKDIADMTNKYCDKIAFVERIMASRINYFGHGAESIEAELQRNNICDAFVLYFNDKLWLNSESWDENYKLLRNILKQRTPESIVAMVDCDATGVVLERVYISRFQKGRPAVPDVLHQVKYGKCMVRYINEDYLDNVDAKKPLRRSAIKIACPGPNCDKSVVHDWVCQKCHAPVEYGAADQYIYCDCGRSPYSNYGFKCKELEHGMLFERFEKGMLLHLLDSLDPMDELNILIIGETGVGKSTFINAFINYLSYKSLDEAIKNDQLDWIIPCSFNYQTMDRSDPNGMITQTKIQVGQDKDEADGASGESATQKTMVYPVTLGDTVIRLIDTPGIGDTRGVEKDKENMANILGMLGNFDKLHGILFLLKSNNSRLGLMFRFVVEELLTHLHRDAALNMVFGFTNTRISNYMPGDTFSPLERLLEKHSRVHIGLSPRTVYCFDSESFRFLAAEKCGLAMENIQDFRLSWEKSERETKRLIEHFRSLVPHSVRSTISLNQTRELILYLTKPMADIMQSIDMTIKLNIDNMQELTNTRLKGDQLRRRLHWEKIELVHHSLDYPRTVCNDVDCKEYRDDGTGAKQTMYKSHCHERCSLTGVEVGAVSCAALMDCLAFNGKENCELCGHHWENHLHVRHELEEEMKTAQDEAIVEQLAKNASDITLKETAIQSLKNKIAESDYEYKEIQDAAVRFGVFLQKHSITPYNDAMEEYLNHLIKEEKGKVNAGGSCHRLENLERHLSEHVQQCKVLEKNITGGSASEVLDETGVEDLVYHLYCLKHWGKNLQDIKDKAEADHLAEYREKPYRPGRNSRSRLPSSRWANSFGWLASTGRAITETPNRRTQVAAPYQSKTSMPRSIPGGMPGGSLEAGLSRMTMTAAPNAPSRNSQRFQSSRTKVNPSIEMIPPSTSSSMVSKLLRPFTQRH